MSDESTPGPPYSAAVVDYCNHPRNVGTLPASEPDVGTGTARAALCHDMVRIQIAVDASTGRVRAARFKAFGCVAALASASFAAEWLPGRTLHEAATATAELVLNALDLPITRRHGADLAVSAMSSAVANYLSKQRP
jgi:NifU-like protein involved in Fe-S cluster formation